jgi:hypothetical protein
VGYRVEHTLLGEVRPSMDVCDLACRWIGTVAAVREPGGGSDADAVGSLVVGMGLLGLSGHLRISATAIQDVNGDCVFLDRLYDELTATDALIA